MLCFRCEHRIRFLEVSYENTYKEKKHAPRPRFECGDITNAVHSCYMFKPVQPIALEPNKNDDRPISLDLLSARVHKSEEQPDFMLDFKKFKNSIIPIWKYEKDSAKTTD